MRPSFGLGLAAGVAILAVAGSAAAERVRTTGSTKVYKRTGEQSAVITRVREGTTLEVIATSGRWLKVRANGRTGWITRSSVVSLAPERLPRNTRRRPFVDGRSLDRGGTDDAPGDRIGADAVDGEDDGRDADRAHDDDDDDDDRRDRHDRRDRDDRDDDRDVRIDVRRPARADARDRDVEARDRDDDLAEADEAHADAPPMLTVRVARARLYQRPSRDARSVLTLREGDRLILLEEHRSGDWLRVEVADDDAVSGYVSRDAVADPGRRGRTIAASARLGFASIGGSFHSDGGTLADGPPPDYPFGSTAISLAVGAEATFPVKGRLLAGGSARYLGCLAMPGIAFQGESVGFTTHDVDLLAVGGYDLGGRRAISVWARAGLHFARFSVSDLANKARLPVETALGPMVGAAVRVDRVTPKLGAEASVDVMPTANRAQTKNQTDGQLAATRTLWLQLAGTYAWRPRWRLEAGYQLGYTATRWVGASDRHMSASGATRTDLAHVLAVGVARPF